MDMTTINRTTAQPLGGDVTNVIQFFPLHKSRLRVPKTGPNSYIDNVFKVSKCVQIFDSDD